MSDIIYIDNKPIPRVDDAKKHFLHRLTILYGPSGSGKSSLIMHILNTLRDVIPLGFVCCPTNATNGDYDRIIPTECIYDDLTADLMKRIFTRQSNVLAMYDMVRSIDTLRPLYDMIADPKSLDKIKKLDKLLNDSRDQVESSYDPDEVESIVEDLQSRYKKKVVRIMRSCIKENLSTIPNHNLTEIQKVIISNLEINPNLLLIIDDCAASIKEWRDLLETKKLFFQGRHFKITTVLTMQNESIIPVPLRTNAHISIFTTEKIVNTYFQKASSGVSPDERKRISKIAATIFAPSEDNSRTNYKKLVVFGTVINTEEKIQYIIAGIKRKKFGSNAIWALCDKVKRDVPCMVTGNSFSKMFNLKLQPQL